VNGMQESFRKFARQISERAGSSWSFVLAVALIVFWIALGPWSGFSDTWQLVINTATTIITFLMVFLIQNSQNRDSKIMQLKLDELLRAVEQARTSLVWLEELSDKDLARAKAEFISLGDVPAKKASETATIPVIPIPATAGESGPTSIPPVPQAN
jgi:low affinity Fe/Cu permease